MASPRGPRAMSAALEWRVLRTRHSSAAECDAIRTSVREAEFLEALARLVGAVRMHHQTRPDSDRATK